MNTADQNKTRPVSLTPRVLGVSTLAFLLSLMPSHANEAPFLHRHRGAKANDGTVDNTSPYHAMHPKYNDVPEAVRIGFLEDVIRQNVTTPEALEKSFTRSRFNQDHSFNNYFFAQYGDIKKIIGTGGTECALWDYYDALAEKTFTRVDNIKNPFFSSEIEYQAERIIREFLTLDDSGKLAPEKLIQLSERPKDYVHNPGLMRAVWNLNKELVSMYKDNRMDEVWSNLQTLEVRRLRGHPWAINNTDMNYPSAWESWQKQRTLPIVMEIMRDIRVLKKITPQAIESLGIKMYKDTRLGKRFKNDTIDTGLIIYAIDFSKQIANIHRSSGNEGLNELYARLRQAAPIDEVVKDKKIIQQQRKLAEPAPRFKDLPLEQRQHMLRQATFHKHNTKSHYFG